MQDTRMQVPPHKTNTECLTLTMRAEYVLTHFDDMLPASERAVLCVMRCSRRGVQKACLARGTCQMITCGMSFAASDILRQECAVTA